MTRWASKHFDFTTQNLDEPIKEMPNLRKSIIAKKHFDFTTQKLEEPIKEDLNKSIKEKKDGTRLGTLELVSGKRFFGSHKYIDVNLDVGLWCKTAQ